MTDYKPMPVRQLLIGTDELWNEIKRWLMQRGIGVAGPLPGDDPELPTYMTYPIQEPRHAPLTDEPCGFTATPAGRRLVDEYRAHRTL